MRLEYEDFYKIAKCLNEINNNIFTDMNFTVIITQRIVITI